MAAITGTALKSKLESMMATFIDKKNTYLKIGKSVSKINYRLKALYNYWVITDQCALTDAEINCIVKDIGTVCEMKISIPTSSKTDIVQSSPTYNQLTAYFDPTCNHVNATSSNYDGQLIVSAKVFEGSGSYTYQWSVLPAVIPHPLEATHSAQLSLLNDTTDTVTINGIYWKYNFQVQCVVTDSVGQTVTIRKEYKDGNSTCVLYTGYNRA